MKKGVLDIRTRTNAVLRYFPSSVPYSMIVDLWVRFIER